MEAETVKKKAAPKRVITHVPPEIIARPATAAETPKVALTLATLAIKHGWHTDATYARDTLPTTQPHLVHSIAVRMRRGRQVAVGVWNAPVAEQLVWKFVLGARLGRWKCLFSSGEGVMPIRLGSLELKNYLRCARPVDPVDLPTDI